jgi:PAS domain S-box-containing protein
MIENNFPDWQHGPDRPSFFEATLASIKDCVCVFDHNRKMVYANPAMQQLICIKTEMPGKDSSELHYPPEFADRLDEHIDSAFTTGETVANIFYPIKTSATLSFTLSPFSAEDGSIEFVVGISQEITEMQALKERLRNTEDHYHSRLAELHATLESISDAVYIGNAEGITLANQAALDQLGFTSKEELNRGIETLAAEINTRDAATGEALQPEQQPFARAFAGERVTQDVLVRHRLSGHELVVRCAASPVIHEGKVIAAVAVNTDVTEQRKAEAALLESEERQTFLLKLSDALRTLSDPVAIQEKATQLLGEHLGVDRTYYARIDEARQIAIIERDYVRDGSYSLAGEHRLTDFRSIIEVIKTGNVFIAYDVADMPEVKPELENYLSIGLRAVLCIPLIKEQQMVAALAVTNSLQRRWTRNEILLLEETAERTWAAVERARAETALKDSETLLACVFDSLPVGVGVFENDGTLSLGNKEVQRYLPNGKLPSTDENRYWRWRAWNEQGKLIERQSFPGSRAKRGEYVLPGIEMLYTQNDGQEVWTQVIAVPLKNKAGIITGQITVVSDIDKIKRTTESLLESEIQFRTYVAASNDVVYRMSADWRELYLLSGKDFLADTELPSEDWFNFYIPEEEQARVWASIKDAIEAKKMFQLEHRVIQASGDIGWVNSRAIPILDKQGEIKEWFGAASDITLRVLAEEQLRNLTVRLEQEVDERTRELKENNDQLRSILDTTLMQISILQAVRNEQGDIAEFVIKLVNKELERETGRNDLVGRLYTQEYPGIKQAGLFDLIVKTIDTGMPQQTEYFYPHEGFNKWFSCMFVKLKEGVVAVNMDITDRKQAEQERFKNYILLQQSEDIARLGSWDFDLLTGVFSWSDGMYRLFHLDKETEVTPDIYLRYSTEEGRPAAERVVRHLREGDTDFAETLELNIGEQIKTMQLKATVITNDVGQPVRVLGVDNDITASRRADEKIRRMEAEQQQEIFRVTLASQEEERRRISESLHNGLGQLLYAIKISMAHVSQAQAVSKPEAFANAKKYTEELLKDAIVESRRISHELMPSMLEEFGLKAAISDVCHQLSKDIQFTCNYKGPALRIDKYMELAIFRTVQELMLNVVKHSQATEARTEVNISSAKVVIVVQDNGQGMAKTGKKVTGIGLASIRSKVKMLNGQIKIDSVPGQGTTVSVQMPLSSPKN